MSLVPVLCEKSLYTLKTFTKYISWRQLCIQVWKERNYLNKKRSVFYNEVCNNKLFEIGYVLYTSVKKKGMQTIIAKTFTSK